MYIGETKETDNSDQNGSGYTNPERDGSRGRDVYTGSPGGSTVVPWMPGLILQPIIPADPRLNIIARINGTVGVENELKYALKTSKEEVVSMAELEFLLALFSNPANYYTGEKSAISWANEVLRNILNGKDVEAAKTAAYKSMEENPYVSPQDEEKAKDLISNVNVSSKNNTTFLILIGLAILIITRK